MDMENEEILRFDPDLPKYYKGQNMYELYEKIAKEQPLTDKEDILISEIQKIYYKRKFGKKENIPVTNPVTLVNIWNKFRRRF